jgi:hypothetical protein
MTYVGELIIELRLRTVAFRIQLYVAAIRYIEARLRGTQRELDRLSEQVRRIR